MRRKQPLVRGCRKRREPIIVRDLYSQRSRPIDSNRDTCVIFVKPDAPVYPRFSFVQGALRPDSGAQASAS
jgi:hypothetical protein